MLHCGIRFVWDNQIEEKTGQLLTQKMIFYFIFKKNSSIEVYEFFQNMGLFFFIWYNTKM